MIYDFQKAVDSPALLVLRVEHNKNHRGIKSRKLLKIFFLLDFTILRFEIVNMYRYTELQGQGNYDFTTLFSNVPALTADITLVLYGQSLKCAKVYKAIV